MFPAYATVAVPSNLLNNMARIIQQQTAITANQHRDLENLLALIFQQSEIIVGENEIKS